MDQKIKELLTRLSFFAEEGMGETKLVEFAKHADALLLEEARKLNTQQPVAWISERGLPEFVAGAPKLPPGTQLYPAPPVPRDVLMAFGEAVRDAVKDAASIREGNMYPYIGFSKVDLTAIADRYASKVQPEPVNQQLLAALKDVTLSDDEAELGTLVAPTSYAKARQLIAKSEAVIVEELKRIEEICPHKNPELFVLIQEYGAAEHNQNDGLAVHLLSKIKTAITAAEAAQPVWPVKWPNGCDKEVPAALRYLADHDRPYGGEQRFNFAHLYQLADEIECMAQQPLYAQQPASPKPVVVPDEWRDAIEQAAEALEDNYCLESAHQLRALLSAAQKPEGVE